MNQERTGEITAQQCYTLVLGMGLDVRRAHLDALILQYNDGKLNHISLEIVMKLFEKVSKRVFVFEVEYRKRHVSHSLVHPWFIAFLIKV
jgi:hypothetical protein